MKTLRIKTRPYSSRCTKAVVLISFPKQSSPSATCSVTLVQEDQIISAKSHCKMHLLKNGDWVKERHESILFALPLGTQNRLFFQRFRWITLHCYFHTQYHLLILKVNVFVLHHTKFYKQTFLFQVFNRKYSIFFNFFTPKTGFRMVELTAVICLISQSSQSHPQLHHSNQIFFRKFTLHLKGKIT